MKARVDEDLCSGCGVCVDTCPEVFKMNDDELAVVIGDSVPDDAQATCKQAADECPVEAILIEE